MLQKELQAIRSLNHENIVKFYDLIESKDRKYQVLEFIDGRDLNLDYKSSRVMTEEEVKVIFVQLIAALLHMNQQKVVHRDLKPANIMISQKDKKLTLKVVDFGLSRKFQDEEAMLSETICGTPYYKAPEVLNYKEVITEKADLWSAGIIFYNLLTKKQPFPARTEKELIEMVNKAVYEMPEGISDHARDLLQRLLQNDPAKRISF
jgi:serine/threonine protein kinase